MKFDWDKILQPKTVVHCPEEQMAIYICKEAHEKGLKWCGGQSYKDYTHFCYKENQCYCFYGGHQSGIDYFIKDNYKIYHYYDVLKSLIYVKCNKTIKY